MISSENSNCGRPLPPAGRTDAAWASPPMDAARAPSLLELAQALHSRREPSMVMEALVEGVRVLFSARLVILLLEDDAGFLPQASAAESAELGAMIRAMQEDGVRGPTAEAARSALDAGVPVVVSLRRDRPDVPQALLGCEIMAAPVLPAGAAPAALLVCRGPDRSFSEEERSLMAAVASVAALAISNAQLYATSEARARESRELAGLGLELNTLSPPADLMPMIVQRAVEMLAAGAGALLLVEGQRLHLRSLLASGHKHESDVEHRLGAAVQDALRANSADVISGPAATVLGAAIASELGWHEVTLARMRPPGGGLVGVLCLADCTRSEAKTRLLPALAAYTAAGLENSLRFARMHEANRHWIEVFDAISDFILVHDDNYRVLRVNRALADFIGVPPQELIGLTTQALMTLASDAPSRPCPFCYASDEERDHYVHPALDRTYLVSTSKISAEKHDNPQTIHVLKDITDRQEAERRYRELFDTIQEGLFFSTPEGRFIEVNDALVRMLGYSNREELLEADIPRQLYLSPEQRQRFVQEIESQGVLRNYEETLRRRDGSLIHSLQNAFAVRDAQGRVLQYRGLMLDITEQKNFQAELQRQRDFNSKILNNTQSMILVLDAQGVITYANRRCFEAGGYRHEDLIGRKLVDLVPPGRRQALGEALMETLAGRQVDNLELAILLGQGRGGQFSVNLSPMRDESGLVDSLVVVMTDITDAAMLQAKLMHTEKMAAVGQLVSGVAHEVNNPLTAILGFADLLLEQPDMPDSARKDLRVIMQEAQRTKQIVQNLLSFARQMPPQRSSVQLNDIVRRTLALRNYDFASHGVQVVERLDERLPEVVGDSHQLQQVFLNILNNAYDAVRETSRIGRIEVTTLVAPDAFVEVSFHDNGDGILYPDRIFDPFFTTKEVGKGTGLGLSICYGIVREHGGEITCRNNPDVGATFTVRLPTQTATREFGSAGRLATEESAAAASATGAEAASACAGSAAAHSGGTA